MLGSPADGSIDIEGQAVIVHRRQIPLADIKLDLANPRVQHAVRTSHKSLPPTQEQLCALILEQPGVSDLFKTIRDNGGLMEPIYVRPDGRVIEGNSRAASFIRLNRANSSDKRWQLIPAYVVPAINERQVAILQGNFHVAGKNKWRAYEKAGHLHTMSAALSMSDKSIAQALGMQERVVTRLLLSYKTMSERVLPKMNGNGLEKWSHVEEFFKNKDLEEVREEAKNVDLFVDLVITQKIARGADVRKLPKIWKNARAMQVLKKSGVDKAIAVLGKHDPTVDSMAFKKVKQITQLLNKLDATDLARLRDDKKPQQLFRALHTAVANVARVTNLKL